MNLAKAKAFLDNRSLKVRLEHSDEMHLFRWTIESGGESIGHISLNTYDAFIIARCILNKISEWDEQKNIGVVVPLDTASDEDVINLLKQLFGDDLFDEKP